MICGPLCVLTSVPKTGKQMVSVVVGRPHPPIRWPTDRLTELELEFLLSEVQVEVEIVCRWHHKLPVSDSVDAAAFEARDVESEPSVSCHRVCYWPAHTKRVNGPNTRSLQSSRKTAI